MDVRSCSGHPGQDRPIARGHLKHRLLPAASPMATLARSLAATESRTAHVRAGEQCIDQRLRGFRLVGPRKSSDIVSPWPSGTPPGGVHRHSCSNSIQVFFMLLILSVARRSADQWSGCAGRRPRLLTEIPSDKVANTGDYVARNSACQSQWYRYDTSISQLDSRAVLTVRRSIAMASASDTPERFREADLTLQQVADAWAAPRPTSGNWR